MGMGNYPDYADVIEQDFVKEVCPKELKTFLGVIKKHDLSLEQFADCAKNGDVEGELCMDLAEDVVKEILDAYDDLCKWFLVRTELELDINYHDKEDRGDDVDGAFWCVDGVYILSSAGKKYKDKIERRGWTVYG